jgi:DNA replication protein DnaC
VHNARAPRLFAELELVHGDGRFARLLSALVKVDLLILDDWGPDRFTSSQRRDLMEIVEDRYGHTGASARWWTGGGGSGCSALRRENWL